MSWNGIPMQPWLIEANIPESEKQEIMRMIVETDGAQETMRNASRPHNPWLKHIPKFPTSGDPCKYGGIDRFETLKEKIARDCMATQGTTTPNWSKIYNWDRWYRNN